MFVTIKEVLDMILMILVVGFVFMSTFKTQRNEDALERYMRKRRFSFLNIDWKDFWFAAMVVAPAIILHELGHKITALSFGLSAVFSAAYIWLAIAIALKLINFPFIFFVPAFVSISGNASITQSTLIAFAGPGVNLLLFLISLIVLRSKKTKNQHFWTLTKNINLFLFIFNMIPIPGFDGFTVFSGLWRMIGL